MTTQGPAMPERQPLPYELLPRRIRARYPEFFLRQLEHVVRRGPPPDADPDAVKFVRWAERLLEQLWAVLEMTGKKPRVQYRPRHEPEEPAKVTDYLPLPPPPRLEVPRPPRVDRSSEEAVQAAQARPLLQRFADIVEAWNRASQARSVDEMWRVFEKLEAKRQDEEHSGQLPFDDAAIHQHKELKRELHDIADHAPDPKRYEKFLKEVFVPGFNGMSPTVKLCPECCKRFAPPDARTRYCSDTCSSRARMRGRDKVGTGKSAYETAALRLGKRIRTHWKNCSACRAARPCVTYDALASQNALFDQALAADQEKAANQAEALAENDAGDGDWDDDEPEDGGFGEPA